MTGTLVASNEGGTNSLACNNANFARGRWRACSPSGISVSKVGERMSASATLDVAALQKLPAVGRDAVGLDDARRVHKANAGDRLHFTPTGTASVTIGGDFLIGDGGARRGGRASARPSPRRRRLKLPGVTITGHAVVKVGADKSVTLQPGAEMNVDVLAGTVTAKITPILDGGRSPACRSTARSSDTAFTNRSTFNFTYNAGAWGG